MKIFYLLLMIVIAFFIVTFSLENTQLVTIRYYAFEETVPAYMLIFAALLIGIIITGFMGIVERFRLTRTISRLNKVIRDLRKELRANEGPPVIETAKNYPPGQP